VRLTRNGPDLASIQVAATTDAEGRYEVRGARKSAKGYMVELSSDAATGHMACQARAADTPGFGPVTLDVAVARGVVISGRVLDGSTRKPMPGYVWARALLGNPFAKDFPEFDSSASFHSEKTAADGSFKIVTIPGPVILMGGPDHARLPEDEMALYRYRPPVPDPKHPKYFPTRKGYEGNFYTHSGGFSPLQGNFCKVLVIEREARAVTQDVVLEPASALPVKVTDADGRPVAGTWVTGVSPQEWHRPVRVAGDTCSAYHLEPGKPRLMVFHDPAGKRFGTLRLKGDEKDTASVKLGPGVREGARRGRRRQAAGRRDGPAVPQRTHGRGGLRARPPRQRHRDRRRRQVPDRRGGAGREVLAVLQPRPAHVRAGGEARKLESSAPAGKPLDLGDIKAKPRPAGGEE
jgi:hypothetical protein